MDAIKPLLERLESVNRGRPRKARPKAFNDCSSMRDVEAATGVSRHFLARAKMVASIPEDEFERLIESDNPPNARKLELLARRRTGKKTMYERRCPHCGGLLRIEDAR